MTDQARETVRAMLFDRWSLDNICGDPDDERIEQTLDEIAAAYADYPPVQGLPDADDYQSCEHYAVYVDSGPAHELFKAFCKSLGGSIETSWKDTEYV